MPGLDCQRPREAHLRLVQVAAIVVEPLAVDPASPSAASRRPSSSTTTRSPGMVRSDDATALPNAAAIAPTSGSVFRNAPLGPAIRKRIHDVDLPLALGKIGDRFVAPAVNGRVGRWLCSVCTATDAFKSTPRLTRAMARRGSGPCGFAATRRPRHRPSRRRVPTDRLSRTVCSESCTGASRAVRVPRPPRSREERHVWRSVVRTHPPQ